MLLPSFYKKTAVAFCCKKLSGCAFDRNATAVTVKAMAYLHESGIKLPIWQLDANVMRKVGKVPFWHFSTIFQRRSESSQIGNFQKTTQEHHDVTKESKG